jgi:hypothetical protein
VWEKPAIIRRLDNRTKDGILHQDMTTVVRIAGYAAPTKEDIANFTAKGISDTAPETGGTINPQGTVLAAVIMCLAIPRPV